LRRTITHDQRWVCIDTLHDPKRFRAVATRFEKTARNFLALTQVACAWLWLASNSVSGAQARQPPKRGDELDDHALAHGILRRVVEGFRMSMRERA